MAEVTFGQPWGLVLLLGLPVVVAIGRRRVAALGGYRRQAALALRLVVFGLLVLALADPRLEVPDRRLSVVFAVDVSGSVPPEQQAAASAWVGKALQAANADDQGAVIAFARQPVVEQFNLAPSSTRPISVLDASGTDLAAALRLAGELAVTGGLEPRVVLLSDGWETLNHAQDAVGWLSAQGVSVSYVPLLAPTAGPEVSVQRMDAPPFVRDGETADVAITLASNITTDAAVTLSVDGRPLLQHPLQLSPGMNVAVLRYMAEGQGTHVLSAEVAAPQDSLRENNRADAVLTVRPPAKILLVEQHPGEADALAAALSSAHLDLERKDPSSIPARAVDLETYDSIVLVDVQATSLPLDQQLTLQSYVRDMGRGLMVVGGPTSFSLGAYSGTELEKMLPVLAAPPDRREQGDLALLLVIDTSGSMSLAYNKVSKIAQAKEAAIQAVSVLKPTDTVGVMVFNTKYQWIVTPQQVAANGGVANLQARINTIKATGGTDIYTALDAAYQTMTQLSGRFRHVLLLTDGQSSNPNYVSLVDHNQSLGITLSTLGIGADADTQLLALLAQHGAGRSYVTQRFDDIPTIVAKETAIATRSSLAEGQFQPSASDPSPLLNGLDTADMPPLEAYVQTTGKPGGTIALVSPRQDPILAHWRYGLGRVVAWTSDAGGTWARAWLGSPVAPAFFAQAARWSMAAPLDPRLNVSADVADRQVTLSAESVESDGSFGDGLDTRATVVTPNGEATQVQLPEAAPGRYQRQFVVQEPGVYQAVIRQVQASGDVKEQVLGFVVDANAEARAIGTNTALLRSLAAQTGGGKLESPSSAFARDFTPHAQQWLAVWPWLLAGALILFPLDVALRRLHVGGWPWFRRPA